MDRLRLRGMPPAGDVPGISLRTHSRVAAGQAGRQHVHRQIDDAGLPVRHTTRRQGRPFTLTLEKTEALFQQDQDTRRQAQRDLDWVVSAFR